MNISEQLVYWQREESGLKPRKHVYAMAIHCQCCPGLWIKIGTSLNPFYRAKQIEKDFWGAYDRKTKGVIIPECDNIFSIGVLATCDGSYKTESAIRKLFLQTLSVKETLGEWLLVDFDWMLNVCDTMLDEDGNPKMYASERELWLAMGEREDFLTEQGNWFDELWTSPDVQRIYETFSTLGGTYYDCNCCLSHLARYNSAFNDHLAQAEQALKIKS
jgi:hypothetical protein